MASMLLARLGALLLRRPAWVVAAWLGLVLAALPLAARLPEHLAVEDPGVPDSESLAVSRALARDFASAASEPWLVVWQGPTGPRERVAIAATTATLRALPGVARVLASTDPNVDPRLRWPADQGGCLIVTLRHPSSSDVERLRTAIAPLDAVLRQRPPVAIAPVDAGLRPHDPSATAPLDASPRPRRLPDPGAMLTGALPLGHDVLEGSAADGALAERRLLLPALLALVWVFGAPVAALLPIAVGFAAITLALAAGTLASSAGVALGGFYPTVASMVGLALGIDYALLMVARYRERRRAGEAPRDAAATTRATAGHTVAVAALVVAAALAALLTVGLADALSIGLAGTLVALSAAALAVGLLPALLILADPWLDWPRSGIPPASPGARATREAWARFLVRTRWPAAGLALAMLVGLAWPAGRYTPGLPDTRAYPASLEAVAGLQALERSGHAGWANPLLVLVSRRDGEPLTAPGGVGPMVAYSRRLHADPRVGEVLGPVDLRSGLPPAAYALLYAHPDDAFHRYPALDGVFDRTRRQALFQVFPANCLGVSGVEALARDLRARTAPGLVVKVGGLAALDLDYQGRLLARLPVVLGWLFVATGLALGLAFRAVLVPLKAIALNLLVVAAAIGTLVWVFQLGHGIQRLGLDVPLGALPALIPLLVFCLTFGLSMDYEVFLLARVREARLACDDEGAAIAHGLGATGGVMAAAAALMVVVFGCFAAAQMVFVKLFGCGLALAITLDATLVRLMLAPALLAIAGRWNWWPGGNPTSATSRR